MFTGKLMEIKPQHTQIEKMIQLNSSMIILENPKGFPFEESNLYQMDMTGTMIWKAERPEKGVFYSRVKLNEDGLSFSAYTTGGHACELDLQTGKLISFSRMQ